MRLTPKDALTKAVLATCVVLASVGTASAQDQDDCSYSVSSTTLSFPAIGGNGTISVMAADGCSWAASVSAGWISITDGATGAGDGTVAFVVAQNDGDPREGSITVQGEILVLTQAGVQIVLPPPSIPPNGVVNAASFELGLVPGGLVSIFGVNLSQGINGTVLPDGETTFRGISVSMGGVPAPLVSISNIQGQEQINVQAPFELVVGETLVEVDNNGHRGEVMIPVFDAQPGIFEIPLGPGGTLVGAAIHLDGDLVTSNAPAVPGEIVSLFLTGGGQVDPPVATGAFGPVPPPVTVLPTLVRVADVSAKVWFSGYAPGFFGLYQINLEIPLTIPPGRLHSLVVEIGDSLSQTSAIPVSSSDLTITPAGVVNGASLLPGPVAPGEIVRVFGSGFGPSELVGFRITPAGFVDTELAGTRVLFDGIPAPLLFVQRDQVGAVVPYATEGRTDVEMVVEYLGRRSNSVRLSVADVAPGIFTEANLLPGFGCCPIFDVNFRRISPSNPTSTGSILILHATGAGQTVPPSIDGEIGPLPLPVPIASVRVEVGGIPVPSEDTFPFSSPAVVGLLQVNFWLPEGFSGRDDVPIVLIIGNIASQVATIPAIR